MIPPTRLDTNVPTAPTGAPASSATLLRLSTVSDSTGASFTAVMLIVAVSLAVSVPPEPVFPLSLTCKVSVVLAAGASRLLM